MFGDGFVREEAVGVVHIDELIFAGEEVLIGDGARVVGEKDDSGFGGFEFGGEALIGHIAIPKAF
jgi:hypothetical protein